MGAGKLAGAILLAIASASASGAGGSWYPSRSTAAAEDPLDQSRVPVLEGFVTPDLAPGGSGGLNFTLRNRYASRIVDVNVTLEIYSYSTVSSTSSVSAATPGHPDLCLRPGQCGVSVSLGEAALSPAGDPVGSRSNVAVDVVTTAGTPHGGQFEPASYLVRVMVDYSYEAIGPNSTTLLPFRLISRGHISDEVWEHARLGGGFDLKFLNATYGSKSRWIAGLATETSFIVREPLPLWPAYLLGGIIIACAAASLALYARSGRKGGGRLDEALEERTREPRE